MAQAVRPLPRGRKLLAKEFKWYYPQLLMAKVESRMIMRSLAGNLNAQNWAAVSIELLVVTVGVFIGIEVSNWNETRLTNDRAKALTETLLSDLRLETKNIMAVYRYHEDVLANAERTLLALTGEKDIRDNDLLISAFRATQYSLRPNSRATYEELVATGGLGLITDKEVQRAATEYFDSRLFEAARRSGVESRYRSLLRETMPTSTHRKIRLACGDDARRDFDPDFVKPGDLLDFACDPGLTPIEIETAAASLRANKKLVPALRLRIAIMDTELADLKASFIDGTWRRFHNEYAKSLDTAQLVTE